MQSFSQPPPGHRTSLLVVELWGVGDVALAIPFLREASRHVRVSLLAKPHAAPLIARFCPAVEQIPFVAPWTAFRGKYHLHRWPWAELSTLVSGLRHRNFSAAVSARPDPRDHALMAAFNANLRVGFPRAGSTLLLTDQLALPAQPHRDEYWQAAAHHFGWQISAAENRPRPANRHLVIHTGAAQPTRRWAREHFESLARALRTDGWEVTLLDEHSGDLPALLAKLATADRFIGNDSGPGHLAALLGVPTFTIFGAQRPENFHPVHPQAAWIDGAPCDYKPCHDTCRFAQPHCIRDVTIKAVRERVRAWLGVQTVE